MNRRTQAVAVSAILLGLVGVGAWLLMTRPPEPSAGEATEARPAGGPREGSRAPSEWTSPPPSEARRRQASTAAGAQSAAIEPPRASSATDAGARHSLDPKGVHAAMEEAMPEVDHCYDEWLKMDPTLGGKFTLNLEIDTDDGVEGRVARIAISGRDGGAGNVAFEGCVLSVVSGLRFEAPLDGSRTVTQPFTFVAPPVAPEQLRPELQRLCQRMHEEVMRAENANVDAADLLTVVLGSLERQTPGLKEYTALLVPTDVPPLQRKRAFERGISKAIGAQQWDCPEFVRLWNGEPVGP